VRSASTSELSRHHRDLSTHGLTHTATSSYEIIRQQTNSDTFGGEGSLSNPKNVAFSRSPAFATPFDHHQDSETHHGITERLAR